MDSEKQKTKGQRNNSRNTGGVGNETVGAGAARELGGSEADPFHGMDPNTKKSALKKLKKIIEKEEREKKNKPMFIIKNSPWLYWKSSTKANLVERETF